MTIQSFTYPKPDNWVTFETFCLKLFQVHLKLPHLEKFARSGHRQLGVDLVSSASGRIIGIQCKVKNTGAGLTQETVDKAIEEAKEFTPHLSEFVIATTADRQPALQLHALRVTRDHEAAGLFTVTIYSWQDIEEILKQNSGLAAELYYAPNVSASAQQNPSLFGVIEQSALGASTIEEVARNLELLVSDLQSATTIYFDAHDVYQMILGIDAFVHGNSFLLRHFASRDTLARCIAAAGWYSAIQVLPMHQVELNRVLVRLFAQPDPDRRLMKGKIGRFLEAAGIASYSTVDTISRERWAELVRERVGDAEKLFKCTYCVRLGSPRNRFLDLTQRGIFVFDEAPNIFGNLINRREFAALRMCFDAMRPETTVNNVIDASAITFLIHEVERYDRSERDAMPLFFASSPLFLRAAEQSGVLHQLYPKNPETRAPIFRDSAYLFLRAIFLSPESLGSSRELEKFRSRLQAAVHLIQGNKREGRSLDFNQLEGIVGDIQSYKFFENVWLTTMAEQDTTWVDLTTHIERLEDKAFQDEVSKAVEDALEQMEVSVKRYELASRLWEQLERKVQLMREARNEFRWTYELLQLGLEKPLRLEALGKLRELSQEESSDSIRALVSKCMTVGEPCYLTSSVAVLWVMKMHKEILAIDMQLEEKAAQEPSWLIIKAACLLNMGRRSAARKVVSSLEELVSKLSGPVRSRGLLGLGFLYYHQFAVSGRRIQWSSKGKLDSTLTSEDILSLEISADCSRRVILETSQHEELAFALAQCLTAQLELPQMDEYMIDWALSQLQGCEAAYPYVWLPQYPLVIARYYHRKALSLNGEYAGRQRFTEPQYKAYMDLLRCAMEWVERALSSGPDENIRSYHAYLQELLGANTSSGSSWWV